MSGILEKRNTIYGLCALWIVLFHVFRRIGMPYIPVVTNIVGIGNMAVDVFFFYSGLCLTLSAAENSYPEQGWGTYYRKRVSRILIPYLIICLPYYLWSALFESSGGYAHKALVFLADLSSASFWLKGKQTTWFAYGIMVFYLVFPLLYTFCRKHGKRRMLVLLAALLGFAILSAHVPALKKSMIVWARLPIFVIGIGAGLYCRPDETAGRRTLLAAIAVLLVFGWITSLSELSKSFTIPQVYRLLLYLPMSVSFLIAASRIRGRSKALEQIGGLSLEVYLIHITLLHPIKYYGVMDLLGAWLYLVLPGISVFLAWIVGLLEKQIKAGVDR